jgi:hypothetical protein
LVRAERRKLALLERSGSFETSNNIVGLFKSAGVELTKEHYRRLKESGTHKAQNLERQGMGTS